MGCAGWRGGGGQTCTGSKGHSLSQISMKGIPEAKSQILNLTIETMLSCNYVETRAVVGSYYTETRMRPGSLHLEYIWLNV